MKISCHLCGSLARLIDDVYVCGEGHVVDQQLEVADQETLVSNKRVNIGKKDEDTTVKNLQYGLSYTNLIVMNKLYKRLKVSLNIAGDLFYKLFLSSLEIIYGFEDVEHLDLTFVRNSMLIIQAFDNVDLKDVCPKYVVLPRDTTYRSIIFASAYLQYRFEHEQCMPVRRFNYLKFYSLVNSIDLRVEVNSILAELNLASAYIYQFAELGMPFEALIGSKAIRCISKVLFVKGNYDSFNMLDFSVENILFYIRKYFHLFCYEFEADSVYHLSLLSTCFHVRFIDLDWLGIYILVFYYRYDLNRGKYRYQESYGRIVSYFIKEGIPTPPCFAEVYNEESYSANYDEEDFFYMNVKYIYPAKYSDFLYLDRWARNCMLGKRPSLASIDTSKIGHKVRFNKKL